MRNSLNKGAVARRLFGSIAILAIAGVILWPGIMVAYNTVVFPGYETCKREISSYLQDSLSVEFDWPPRRFSRHENADIWGYAIVMYTTRANGGGTASMVECTVGVAN